MLRRAFAPALLGEHAEAACVDGVVHDRWWMSGRQPSACIENTVRQDLQLHAKEKRRVLISTVDTYISPRSST